VPERSLLRWRDSAPTVFAIDQRLSLRITSRRSFSSEPAWFRASKATPQPIAASPTTATE
jgi:hypothetical protein